MTPDQILFLAFFAPAFGGSLFWLAGHVAFSTEA
jgi:hypothetical protein